MFIGTSSDPRKNDSPYGGKPRDAYISWKFPFKATVEVSWDELMGSFCFIMDVDRDG